MRIDPPVLAKLLEYVDKYPVPQRQSPDETDVQVEERCRQWSIRWAQQATFSFPNQGYGTKRADGGRPISKDGFAQQVPPSGGGRLYVWDLVTGAGTGQGRFVGDSSDAQDITGQVFVEVEPLDSLGTGAPTVPDQPTSPSSPVSDFQNNLYTSLGRIELALNTIKIEDNVGTVIPLPETAVLQTKSWMLDKCDQIIKLEKQNAAAIKSLNDKVDSAIKQLPGILKLLQGGTTAPGKNPIDILLDALNPKK